MATGAPSPEPDRLLFGVAPAGAPVLCRGGSAHEVRWEHCLDLEIVLR